MEIKELYRQAQTLGVCSRFRGNETKESLIRLFLSPQGLEFCRDHAWPSLEQMREFRGPLAERLGLYIDAGKISLHGARKVVLIGNTQAQLYYDDMAQMRHQVVVMHSAQAVITASAWAVVFVANMGGEVQRHITDNAKVL